jgi:hypothetical protein
MPHLKRAHDELFRRAPDECFASLADLLQHCRRQKEESLDRWLPPSVAPEADGGRLRVRLGTDGAFLLNDWSFTQFCQLAQVSKDTVNRLQPDTASRVLQETLPAGSKPIQLLTQGEAVRSVHGVSYTRLYNTALVAMIQVFATDFQPPQRAMNGGTGPYASELDPFAFLIDPTGWSEIDGEAFAPGFFVWNSEVGKRSLGIEMFWVQAVCLNHIVWDACEVVVFTRKYTASIHDSLAEMRRLIEQLVLKRDERRDGFVRVIRKAMSTTLGDDAEASLKVLGQKGITRALATRALEIARTKGRFTIFSVVNALTRLAGESEFAGERMESDRKAAQLLELAA